jgi:hypothetical protein
MAMTMCHIWRRRCGIMTAAAMTAAAAMAAAMTAAAAMVML